MSKTKFTISNDSDYETIKHDLIRFKSYIDLFKSIQQELEGSEVDGTKYGGLLLLNNLIFCLESQYEAYVQSNYLASLSLNRHFIDLFMDVRVSTEDLSNNFLNPSSKIKENLRQYASLILWKEAKFHEGILTEKSLDKNDPIESDIIESSKTMNRYLKTNMFELGLSDFNEMIANRKERRIPTYRDLIVKETRKHPAFKELHYPWASIEFKRGAIVLHGEYNSLQFSGNKCVADKQNINYNPVLIKSQLIKLDALEYWIKAIYRALWPEITWGKFSPRVKKNLKD
jgi:hypothetical protein